ncbi:MAG: hypothetical protein MJZ14_07980 [Paludibacteraceae bacterium]|nr:hypothetical protein [Paludibacteraceae bacterium]
MKRFFVYWVTALMALAFISSCEEAPQFASDESSEDIIFVNGVKYKLRNTALTVDHGLYFTANFNSLSYKGGDDELTIFLSMDDCKLNHEYDLSDDEDGGKKYLQVFFSDAGKDSYSVAMIGPNKLNILKASGKNEERNLSKATAKIGKDKEGRFYFDLIVDGDGLTVKMDWDGWIDDLDD